MKLKKAFNSFLYKLSGLNVVNQKHRNINSRFNFFSSLLKNEQGITIFDVGMHKGLVTDFFLDILSKNKIFDYKIHGFEPDKKLFEKLLQKYNDKNITINNFALSDDENIGYKDFYEYYNPQKNSLNMIDKNLHNYISKTKVRVKTLNDYCAEKKINKITLLKIDAEAEEPNILKGASQLITKNQIKFISTELTTGYYENKSLRISDIENKLTNNYQLIGIDVMESYSEIMRADKNNSMTLGLIYFNKVIN